MCVNPHYAYPYYMSEIDDTDGKIIFLTYSNIFVVKILLISLKKIIKFYQ